MAAVERGARAQDDSRALVEAMLTTHERLEATLANVRAGRAARRAARRPR